jgi:hypothetical protein
LSSRRAMQTPVIDFINTRHDTFIDELKTLLAIPSMSALPEHAADVRRCAEWTAAELTRIGMHGASLVETPGHPVVYAEWLGAPRRAHRPVLRPLRRAAGRSARPLDLAALRGHGARRRTLRARRGGRQGPGLHAHEGHRGAPVADRRRPAGEHQGHPRRRRGSRQRQPRRLHQGATRTCSRPTSSSSATRRCSTATCRRSATACAGCPTSRSTCAARSRTCTRAVRRRRGESGDGAGDGARSHEGQGAAASRFPASTTTWWRCARKNAPSSPSCRSTRSATAWISARRSCSARRGYSTLERVWARPTFEVNGLAVRVHRRRRQDGAAGRGDGQGQHAPRAQPGSRRRSAISSRTT